MAVSYVKKAPAIANNLTTTDAGSVLDARQGKTLSDQMAKLKSVGYRTFINGQTLTKTETEYSTYNSRKFSDYGVINFVIKMGNYIRDSILMPRELFTSGENIDYKRDLSGTEYEVLIKYQSDTSVKMIYISSGTVNVQVYISTLVATNSAVD